MFEKHIILKASSMSDLLLQREAVIRAFPEFKVVYRRYFLPDGDCSGDLPSEEGAVSVIIQPPLGEYRIALWLYMVGGAGVTYGNSLTVVHDGDLSYFWNSCILPLSESAADSFSQTSDILESYESFLVSEDMDISTNCVRTWFFVDDIDHNYAGMVESRRKNFLIHNLTPSTHYIASTGIWGRPADRRSTVQMEALAMKGDFRQRYLQAPSHLNPTYEYGVTFERAVRIDCADNGHILISGTASINNRGEVVHIGDIVAQTRRMWDNVEALLKEGGAGWESVVMVIVYIRNSDDYPLVGPMFEQKFHSIPYVMVQAPVCRPDWLIEMEAIADVPPQSVPPVH